MDSQAKAPAPLDRKSLCVNVGQALPPANRCSHRFRVQKRSEFAALPEVCKDDHARNCRVGTPKRSESITLDQHYGHQNHKICSAEDDHVSDFGKEKRTTRCDYIS